MDGPPPRDDASRSAEAESRDDDAPPPKKRTSPVVRALRIVVGLCVLAALIVGGVLYWLEARHYENTDDAFVDGHITQMAAQVSGRVQTLLVDDNQHVTAGQKLLLIDPRDYQTKLDQMRAQLGNAEAGLAQARAQEGVQRANLDQAAANVRVTEADLVQAQQDFARYKNIDPKAITRQQLDNSSAGLRSAEAKLDANRQAAEAARAQIAAAAAQTQAAQAQVKEAQSNVANAELQLSYASLTAPADGRITRRTVNVGDYVQPGQALFAIVQDRMWVTADFKETQLTDMRPGQQVQVTIDAYPDATFAAHVDSIQSGTGSVFSSLPAENATGNYVKVTQRVPVKILFDDDKPAKYPLAPGMSVEPRVTVR